MKYNQKRHIERITMDINKVTYSVSNFLPEKPNISSHNFRIDYIWKDTKDSEFVRQTIGHHSLNTTLGYVSEIGEEEHHERISKINT